MTVVDNKKVFEKLPIVGTQPKTEAEEAHLKELVKVEFYNLEEPGVSMLFPYGSTVFNKKFLFFHGGKYEIPRHVVKWVESLGVPIYKWKTDGDGKMQKAKVGFKPRFSMRTVH